MGERSGAARRSHSAAGVCLAMGLAWASAVSAQGPGGPPGAPPGAPPGGAPEGLGPTPEGLGTVLMPKPPSANAPKPNKNPRDFEGIYIGLITGSPLFGGDAAPYTPKAQVMADRRAKLARHQISVEGPAQSCRPYNNVANASQPVFPLMIVQNEKRVLLLLEEGRGVMEIHLDREHPQPVTPTWNGHSIGRWEGDTLVVDIIGYNGKAHLDFVVGPNSDKAHYVIRIKKNVENGNLDLSYTLTDPEIYAQPKTTSFGLMWHPEMKIHEFDCESSLGFGTFPGYITQKEEDAVAASLPD